MDYCEYHIPSTTYIPHTHSALHTSAQCQSVSKGIFWELLFALAADDILFIFFFNRKSLPHLQTLNLRGHGVQAMTQKIQLPHQPVEK